jgi:hypothetical protein
MRASHVPGLVVTACAALVAGCGGLPSAPATGIANQEAPGTQPAGHRISWMGKGLKQRDLLYVSNANGTVSVYRYWQRTLVGVLTDFKKPMGECADKAGDVYMTDFSAHKIYEYGHGGTKPIRTIDDSSYTPYGCSVAASNGDLAVTNSPYDYFKAGNIAIYRHATGKPFILQGTRGEHFTSCAYDDRGDLLAMSEYMYSPFWYFQFYYLPKNSTKLIAMTLPGITYSTHASVIQGVAWDGKYWAVGPWYNYVSLYTIDVKATMEGTVDLATGDDIFPGPVAFYRTTKAQATQAVAGAGSATAYYWKYPAGGSYFAEITQDLDKPFGIAISLGSP